MSEPLLNSPTSDAPSTTTPLQVLKEQLVVAKAKRVKASGTKSEATPALGKENAKPVKQRGKNKAEKCEPEIKKEENDCVR